ncbi:MAG: hypothetical protein HGA96_17410 [Desulfobulbaceae bacterium]|nr:hypothetical protein [Desulfobulbaceae bacterium]
MKKTLLVIAVFVLSLCLCPLGYALSNAKLTAKIVDENGTAIQGAHVTLSFSGAKQGDGGGMVNFGKEGFTDNEVNRPGFVGDSFRLSQAALLDSINR